MSTGRARGLASALCAGLGVLLILTALLLGYARRSLFDERAFSARMSASLEDPRVSSFVAEQVTDAVIGASPDLVGLRPVLIGLSRAVISSPPFRVTFRKASRAAHRALMSGTAVDAVLTLRDVSAVLQSAAATQPALQKKIPPKLSAALVNLKSLPGGERAARLVELAKRMRATAWGLLGVGVLLCAASVWLASEKRHAILRLGFCFVAAAVLLVIVGRFGGFILSRFVGDEATAPAVAGLTRAFLDGLRLWGWGLGFVGLVLAAASASLLERVPLRAWVDGTRYWLTAPQPMMRYRFLRGLVMLLAGGAILLYPIAALIVFGTAIGIILAFAGLREAFAAALHTLPELADSRSDAGARRSTRRGAPVLVGSLAAVLAGITALLVLKAPAAPVVPEEITTWNGSAKLGDRRLDQVVFPTAHNAMAGADVTGWMFPNQGAGIEQQLADGIRGFLIDAHYARPVGDKVKTELEDERAAMAKYEAVLGKEGIEAGLRIRDRLVGLEEGERDIYMCHGLCEIGALKLTPVLSDMRDFLVANPGEVLIIVIQDESVAPADIARCFEESGLIDFVYQGPAGPWPTLREMVDTDQRVVVMAENDCAGVSWYHKAFDIMGETPYSFHDASEFSNKPNRGGPGGSLLLMNHWIDSAPMPKPTNAVLVNAREALLSRIRNFERERGRVPNLVAVDFYAEGDLFQVVRELNDRDLTEPKPRGRKTGT